MDDLANLCGKALGLDVCWATADVSAWKGEGVVHFLHHFTDVVIPAEGFVVDQTQVLGGVDIV
jgi:hypothetical protein